jgi:hypothetical protein
MIKRVVFRFAEIVTVFLLFTLPVMSVLYVVSLLTPGYIESAPSKLLAELSFTSENMTDMGSPSDSDNLPKYMDDFCVLVYRATYLSLMLLLHPIII